MQCTRATGNILVCLSVWPKSSKYVKSPSHIHLYTKYNMSKDHFDNGCDKGIQKGKSGLFLTPVLMLWGIGHFDGQVWR